ncbi:MAG: hypothetical protein LC641_10035 [Spirochaeta sp.]|nr:hypothetical protein [Spirochaeta sp.]
MSIVLPDELTPGERFWETIVLPPVEADAPAEVSIVAIEVVRADGSVWREDDPDTISNTLTVGGSP